MEQQRHQTGEAVNDQHFKVPVFREIYYIAPSEQNRMIKTPPPHTKFLMNISRSIYI
jgi:hypothetical protein